MKRALFALMFTGIAFGQSSTDGDQTVMVPKKYVSQEGLQHQVQTKDVSQWLGIGKEIGIATKEGLESVVDVSEKFGTTNVGHFVMFMVAWKIIGKSILAVVLGIPLWIAGVCLWMYSMRRFFWGVNVVSKINADKSKEFVLNKYKFDSGEARATAGFFHGAFLGAWCILWIVAIFF
jgi:hypothetical protein